LRTFIIIFIAFSTHVTSQSLIGAGMGFDVMSGNTNELNTFVESFNTQNVSLLSEPLNKFGLTKGYSFSAGGNFDTYSFVIGAWFSRANMFQKSKATFVNNTGIEVVQHIAKSTLYTDYGWWVGDNVIISGTIGASLWRNDVRVYSTYADGSKSIGQESSLNGIYQAYNASFDLGLNISVVLEPVKLDFRILKDYKFTASQLLDVSAGKGINDQHIPIDFSKNSFSEDNRMSGNFSGFYFSLSAVVFLSTD
jgi:hypothetical protein